MALLRKDLGACAAKLADLERRHAAAQQAAGAAQARSRSCALIVIPGGLRVSSLCLHTRRATGCLAANTAPTPALPLRAISPSASLLADVAAFILRSVIRLARRRLLRRRWTRWATRWRTWGRGWTARRAPCAALSPSRRVLWPPRCADAHLERG